MQLQLDRILCGYWEIFPVLLGYAPSTPHYNGLLHPSLVSISVALGPIVEYYWKVQCYFERKDVTSFRTRAFVFFVPPHGQNPPIHIYVSLSKHFMYDALLITFYLDIYHVKFKNYSKGSCLFISLTTIHTHPLSQSNIIGDPQNPHHSIFLHNLPPILGGVPSPSRSLTQPYHSPVSANILRSILLGSNFLGSNS